MQNKRERSCPTTFFRLSPAPKGSTFSPNRSSESSNLFLATTATASSSSCSAAAAAAVKQPPAMDEYHCRKSGQIPAFGDWDHANELPITQYFECARQAGLLRFSSSSGESDRTRKSGDLYAVAAADEHKLSRSMAPHKKAQTSTLLQARTREKRNVQLKEQRRTGRVVREMKEPPRKQHLMSRSQHNAHHHHHRHLELPMKSKPSKPKAVDEDLYKIPPHLLHTTKRKKVLGFFSRCLVPACTA